MNNTIIPAEMLANSSAATTSNSPVKGDVKTRKTRAKDLWYYIGAARVEFKRQFKKTNVLKWMILDNKFTCTYDREKLFLDYAQQVRRLLDSRRFNEDAKKMGGNPIIVATHVVFLGKTAVNKVLEYGLNSVMGEETNLFKEPFIDNETLEVMNLTMFMKTEAQTDNAQ